MKRKTPGAWPDRWELTVRSHPRARHPIAVESGVDAVHFQQIGVHAPLTFDIVELTDNLAVSTGAARWIFVSFAVAFAASASQAFAEPEVHV